MILSRCRLVLAQWTVQITTKVSEEEAIHKIASLQVFGSWADAIKACAEDKIIANSLPNN